MKKCLVVSCHPLDNSLCRNLANQAERTMRGNGYDARWIDLYDTAFPPALSAAERSRYYQADYPGDDIADHVAALRAAEVVVLVFPTWWFGFPAVLKGWFDRVWVPGVAYDHSPDYGPLKPLLHDLKHVVAVTTLGSPWWVDRLIMRRPVRRVLKTALVGACAPKARFHMLSLYKRPRMCPPPVSRRFSAGWTRFCGDWAKTASPPP